MHRSTANAQFSPVNSSGKNGNQKLMVVVAILSIVASLGGLLIPDLYRDAATFKTAWLANDVVTLVVAAVMLYTNHHNNRRDEAAELLQPGLLMYLFYNYSFYLLGATFNYFFLVYAALFTLTFYALFIRMLHIKPERYSDTGNALRRRAISVFLLAVAIPLGAVELGECIRFIIYEKTPQIPTLVLSLDLTLVIPNLIVAAVLLWQGNPWGYVLTAIMLVKSAFYGLVLVSGALFIAMTGVGKWDPLLPFYIFTSAGGFIFLTIFLKEVRPGSTKIAST